MKQRRGIELGRPQQDSISYLGPILDPINTTFGDLPEWHAVGVHCQKCEREAWLDRWEIERKWGKRVYVGSLTQYLRCRGCGNKDGSNKWILGALPR